MDDFYYDPQKGKHLMLTFDEYIVLRRLVLNALSSDPRSSQLNQILFQLS